ncbi:hypothetical protein ACFWAR_21720 [Streptomyces sp. NPDC059917]|uniref:hypothetical protein n=1 Tax=Streptomyces sp. NPDC059917 TaxID=3347002 RepID=UPI00365532A6
MSRRTDNRHRVATLCREATGLPHHICLQWAADGLISRALPVPDAESPAQRAFEARVVVALADALTYEPTYGALLGITAVRPTASGLGIELDPRTSHQVFAALMPMFDAASGALDGVPGLRRDHRGDGGLHLRCAAGGGAIRLLPSAPAWQRPLSRAGAIALGYGDTPLHGVERARLDDWDRGTAARDRLLSRVLRRPRVLNAVGAAHGRANTYGHGRSDLVIEWDADPGIAAVERGLRRSGLAAPAPGAGPPDPPAAGIISLGGARLVLRTTGEVCPAC